MALIPLYRDLLCALQYGPPFWPAFAAMACRPHQAYFDGLMETYGADMFGPAGLPGAVEQLAPTLRLALAPAPLYGLEQSAAAQMDAVAPLLPGRPPDIYLGTLFFTAPAATLAVGERPAIALGLERFHPAPPPAEPKVWYHPREIEEIIPHEAAHCARMQALGLPPSPQRLSLLDMVMLEGTALAFTDLLLGRESLATFMPADRLAWHMANDARVRAQAATDFQRCGMAPFRQYFSSTSPVSGYYVGLSLCREYLKRYGAGAMAELLMLPSQEILRRLG